MIHKVIQRLSEPSTWAGLSGLAVIFGSSAEDWQTWANGLAGLFAMVAMVAKERGSEPATSGKHVPLGRILPGDD